MLEDCCIRIETFKRAIVLRLRQASALSFHDHTRIIGTTLARQSINRSGKSHLSYLEDLYVAVRPMMYIALTYDHRLIDGREALLFLKQVKSLIEEPARLLLEF